MAGIIFLVPTPFYHLSLAESLLLHPELPEAVWQFLSDFHGEFLFGNTAPDVQVISGQPRQDTHFFDLPIKNGDPPAWELFLDSCPQLADGRNIPVRQAAFIAGYLCHLQADWMWVNDIFAPVFGPYCTWGTFSERLYLHNVLRAYLDVHILAKLSAGIDGWLNQVEPEGWLPFVGDHALRQWRDILYPQLLPGAVTQTVEVFSSRQGISAPTFHELLGSEERMQREVFTHITREQIQGYHERVVEENLHLLSDYLAFSLHPIKKADEGVQI